MKLFVILTGCLLFLLEIRSSTGLPQENQGHQGYQGHQGHQGYQDDQGNQEHQENFRDVEMMSDKMDMNFQEGIDICRSNQAQINLLVEKFSGQNINEEGLNRLQEKLNDLDEKFEMISKSSKNDESNSVPVVLMKNLEKKLSRLQYSLDRSMLRKSISQGPRLGNENSSLEETLSDIIAKLDALEKKSEAENAFENPKEGRHMGKGCRMLAGPYKKLLSSVDNIQKIVKDMEGNEETGVRGGEIRNSFVQDIRSGLENILDEIQVLRKKNEKNLNENGKILRRIDRKLDSELEDDDKDDEKLKKSLKRYMIEQRRILEKKVQKMLKDKKDDDDDDDDDDDSDDDDDDDEKRKNKSKKKKSKDDDDDDDDDDDTDDSDDSDDSEDDDKNKNRKKNKDDTEDDDDDEDNDDDVECDDSDENGSKSCEREKKKAYSRGKKKPKFDSTDSDSDTDDSMPLKGKRMEKKYKVKKDVRDIESLGNQDTNDKLVADEPVQNGNFWAFLAPQPPDQPTKPNKHPDVTP